MIRIILAAALLCVFSINADARVRHRSAACVETGTVMAPVCGMGRQDHVGGANEMVSSRGFLTGVRSIKITMHRDRAVVSRRRATERPVSAVGAPSPSLEYTMATGADRIARPMRYIAGRLICAINVNAALAERGIRGTGSALAKSFLGWGVASGPVPGAVAVSSRRGGGHVAIVSRVEGGQVYVWNPSPRGRGWQEVAYRHHAISFRVPG